MSSEYSIVLRSLSLRSGGMTSVSFRRVAASIHDEGPGRGAGAFAEIRRSGLAHDIHGGLPLGGVVGGASGILPRLLGVARLEDVLRNLDALDVVHAVVLRDVRVEL